MKRPIIDRASVLDYFDRIDHVIDSLATVYLTDETSLVVEGWKPWTGAITICLDHGETDTGRVQQLLSVAQELNLTLIIEHPGEIIPLPGGYQDRARRVDGSHWSRDLQVNLYHFDPYSVSFRAIARGSEPDYHLVLQFLEHRWCQIDEMEARLIELLPAFSFETIQQDPAEFRRRYSGLMQMWRKRHPDAVIQTRNN